MKTPEKQGAKDRSFLLDTVRHISRHQDFSYLLLIGKKIAKIQKPPMG
jgi:hypothetical protein